MKSVNKVILVGHLGKDPELRYTPTNLPVAKFSVATNERYKDKDGNWQDRTEWHNVVCWQRLAEIANEYLRKGNQVYIEGRIQTRSWDDKQTGQKKYMTEIIASDLVLLGGRPEGAEPRARSASAHAPAQASAAPEAQPMPEHENSTQITDEDIPF